MRFGDRSDEELIRLAQAGWAPAFAVLVYRYAPVVRATRPRAEPAVPFLTHVFLEAMRELHERDPRTPVAPWLLGLAGEGAKSATTPVPLSPDELDAIWAQLHHFWPDGHRHVRNVPWRQTAAVVGLAALAGLVPAVVLGADGPGAEGEPLELRAVPLPDERTAKVAEKRDDEPDFSFPTMPEEQDAPPPEPAEPSPGETETAQPDPEQESEDSAAGEDDGRDGEAEDTEPDEEGEDDEGSGGLLDDVLGEDGEDDGGDEAGDDAAVEEQPEEGATAEEAASDESEGS